MIELSEYLVYILPGTVVLVCLLFKFLYKTRNEEIILSRMNSQRRPESPNELSTIQSHSSSTTQSQRNEGNTSSVELDLPRLISRYHRHGSESVTIAPLHLPSSSRALPSASSSSYFDPPPPYPGYNTSTWINLSKLWNILGSLDINVNRLLLLEFKLALSKMWCKFILNINTYIQLMSWDGT